MIRQPKPDPAPRSLPFRSGGLLAALIVFPFLFLLTRPTLAAPTIQPAASKQDPEANELTPSQQLKQNQARLAEQYRLLEEKLFSLYEFEQDSDPTRSKLLQRAFIQSQENMTATEMKVIVDFLDKSRLKEAEKEQQRVLADLNKLLELLQSEDRGKRVRDEIQRHQDYLQEVERLLRIQKGIRGQAEGGVDPARLSRSEQKAAERTGELAKEIGENESDAGRSQDAATADRSESPMEPPTPGQNPSLPKQGSGDPGSEKGRFDSQSPGDSGDGESSPGTNSETPQVAPLENPVRKKIRAAEDRMQQAQRKLDEAKQKDAIEDMKNAERDLALAKRELENILRQLREEEVERTLAMLEGRFRQMLERQVRVYESTRKLDRIAPNKRGTDFEIQTGKLAVEQNAIASEAEKARMLLIEDGSSVAFPVTVEEMQQDMLQVAGRLSSSNVGQITIEIEEDIIETLDYVVKALMQSQKDSQKIQPPSAQSAGQPGEMPLVDQLAEIRMLRGLQDRIHKRHQRYGDWLENPEDPVGTTDDPEIQAALNRLAERQSQLTQIARDILSGKNK